MLNTTRCLYINHRRIDFPSSISELAQKEPYVGTSTEGLGRLHISHPFEAPHPI